jgi:hypothetical protein
MSGLTIQRPKEVAGSSFLQAVKWGVYWDHFLSFFCLTNHRFNTILFSVQIKNMETLGLTNRYQFVVALPNKIKKNGLLQCHFCLLKLPT